MPSTHFSTPVLLAAISNCSVLVDSDEEVDLILSVKPSVLAKHAQEPTSPPPAAKCSHCTNTDVLFDFFSQFNSVSSQLTTILSALAAPQAPATAIPQAVPPTPVCRKEAISLMKRLDRNWLSSDQAVFIL